MNAPDNLNVQKRNDLVLIAVVLAAAALLFFIYIFTRKEGARVVVRVDGKESGSFSLDEDREVTLAGVGGTNVLVISGGIARVTEADCPDKLCVHQGSIRYSGQSIVCLPHRLTVEVAGGDAAEIDAVAK